MSDIDVESMKAAFARDRIQIAASDLLLCRLPPRFDCPALAHLIWTGGFNPAPPPDSCTFGPTGI